MQPVGVDKSMSGTALRTVERLRETIVRDGIARRVVILGMATLAVPLAVYALLVVGCYRGVKYYYG